MVTVSEGMVMSVVGAGILLQALNISILAFFNFYFILDQE
jgi:hypothetical protein